MFKELKGIEGFSMKSLRLFCIVSVFLLLSTVNIQAQEFPPAQITNDEGGPVSITGEVVYTNPFFTSGVTQPMVILEDQAGFVDRDEGFLFPRESQTLGQITSNFYESPFTYSIALPIEPQGSLRDVDHDSEEDNGVMIFAIAYWDNTWGDPFLEARDQSGGGWSTAYASTRISEDPERLREVVGGKFLIYAPDDEQGFPSGFGDDGLLFTEDDPIVSIPQGYSIVDMDTTPFTFDRARRQDIDLIEPEGAVLTDFSNLSFTESFDAMIDKFKREYAFTELKQIDWDAIADKYRPLFVEAEQNDDEELYLNTLSDIIWSLPDGHINISPFTPYQERFVNQVGLGIGIVIEETDDQQSFVVYVQPGSPADREGISVGTEILSVNGLPIADYISRVKPFAETYSTPHNRRLAQARYAMRFPIDTEEIEIAYQNEGESEPVTTNLSTSDEFDSLFYIFESGPNQTGFELPVEYRLLENGYGYAKIYSFFDNRALSIQLWERMIQTLNDQGIPGLVIDMRENGGGNGFLADQMAAYFFDEPLVLGYRSSYSREAGEFFLDTDSEATFFPPPENLRYDGAVAVLIGPNCASACERFAYNMTLEDRAAIVGSYPTAGLGGGVEDFLMPLGMTIRFTVTRSVDANQEIHIEGRGIAPTIDVPVTNESLFTDEDLILDTAIDYLDDAS
jgi:C-terminal processing protease CtpA/Prc